MQKRTAVKKKSPARDMIRRFKKNKPATAGLIIFLLMVLISAFANLITPAEMVTAVSGDILQPPSSSHWFGTDQIGRDVFARIIYGGRISLSIGFVVTGISMAIGSLLGAAAGYFCGIFDSILMRILDVLMCIPPMLLTMAIIASLGVNLTNLLIALTVSSIPSYVRLVRASVINLTDMEYVQCAYSYGTPSFRIIVSHVLPNAVGPIIITAAGSIAATILSAAGLSFLGFGVQAPTPEWGAMVSESRTFMREAPHLTLFPGIAIVIAAMCINLAGDGLRDVLDPRLKD